MDDIFYRIESTCAALASYSTLIPPVLAAVSEWESNKAVSTSQRSSTPLISTDDIQCSDAKVQFPTEECDDSAAEEGHALRTHDSTGSGGSTPAALQPQQHELQQLDTHIDDYGSADSDSPLSLLVSLVAQLQRDSIRAGMLQSEVLSLLRVAERTGQIRKLYDGNTLLLTAMNEAEDILASAAATIMEYQQGVGDSGASMPFISLPLSNNVSVEALTSQSSPLLSSPPLPSPPLPSPSGGDLSSPSLSSPPFPSSLPSGGRRSSEGREGSKAAQRHDHMAAWNPRLQTSTIANLTLAHIVQRQHTILTGEADDGSDMSFLASLSILNGMASEDRLPDAIASAHGNDVMRPRKTADYSPSKALATLEMFAQRNLDRSCMVKLVALIRETACHQADEVLLPADIATHFRMRTNAALMLAKAASNGDFPSDAVIRCGGLHAILSLAKEIFTASGTLLDRSVWLPLCDSVVISVVTVASAADDLRALWKGLDIQDAGSLASSADDALSDRTVECPDTGSVQSEHSTTLADNMDASSAIDTVLHCILTAIDLAAQAATPTHPHPNARVLFESANALSKLCLQVAENANITANDLVRVIVAHSPSSDAIHQLLLPFVPGGITGSSQAAVGIPTEEAWAAALRKFQQNVWASDCNSFGTRMLPLLGTILDPEWGRRTPIRATATEFDFSSFFQAPAEGSSNDSWWITQARRRTFHGLKFLAAGSLRMRKAALDMLRRAHSGVERLRAGSVESKSTAWVEHAWRYAHGCCAFLSPPVDLRMTLVEGELRLLRPYLPFHPHSELSAAAAAVLRMIVAKPADDAALLVRPSMGPSIDAPILASPAVGGLRRMESAPTASSASTLDLKTMHARTSGSGSKLGSIFSYFGRAGSKEVDDYQLPPSRTRSASDAPPSRAKVIPAMAFDDSVPTSRTKPSTPSSSKGLDSTPSDALEAWEQAVSVIVRSGLLRLLVAACTDLPYWGPASRSPIATGNAKPPAPPRIVGASKQQAKPLTNAQASLRETTLEVTRALAASARPDTRRMVVKNGGVAILAAFIRLKFESIQERRRMAKAAILGKNGRTGRSGTESNPHMSKIMALPPNVTKLTSSISADAKLRAFQPLPRGRSQTESGEVVSTTHEHRREKRLMRRPRSPNPPRVPSSLRRIASLNRLASTAAPSMQIQFASHTASEMDLADQTAGPSDTSLMSASGSDNDVTLSAIRSGFTSPRAFTRSRLASAESTDNDELPSKPKQRPTLSRVAESGQQMAMLASTKLTEEQPDLQLRLSLEALSSLSNVLNAETVQWYVEHGGLYILILILLQEAKASRTQPPKSKLYNNSNMYLQALSGIMQLVSYGSSEVCTMVVNSRGLTQALGVFLRSAGPGYPCRLHFSDPTAGPELCSPAYGSKDSDEATLHMACILSKMTDAMLSAPAPGPIASLCSLPLISGMTLLIGNDNAETSRRALQALVNLCHLQLSTCSSLTGTPHPAADQTAAGEGYVCLICGFGCASLSPTVSLVTARYCAQQYGITSESPVVLASFEYSSDARCSSTSPAARPRAHDVTGKRRPSRASTDAARASRQCCGRQEDADGGVPDVVREFVDTSYSRHSVKEYLNNELFAPPILSFFSPNGLVSPALSAMVPPATCGVLCLLICLAGSVNIMILEESLRGMAALLRGKRREIRRAVATFALPLIAALCKDDKLSNGLRKSITDCLMSLGILDINQDYLHCPVLTKWKAKWLAVGHARAQARRLMLLSRAWENPSVSKAWTPIRLQLQEMDVSVIVLAVALQNAHCPGIHADEILLQSLGLREASFSAETSCFDEMPSEVLKEAGLVSLHRAEAVREALILALQLEALLFACIAGFGQEQKLNHSSDPSVQYTRVSSSIATAFLHQLSSLRKPVLAFSAVPPAVSATKSDPLSVSFACLSADQSGVNPVAAAHDADELGSTDDVDDRSSAYSAGSHPHATVRSSLSPMRTSALHAARTTKRRLSDTSRIVCEIIPEVFPSGDVVDESSRMYEQECDPSTHRPDTPIRIGGNAKFLRNVTKNPNAYNPNASTGSSYASYSSLGASKGRARPAIWTIFSGTDATAEPSLPDVPSAAARMTSRDSTFSVCGTVPGVNHYVEDSHVLVKLAEAESRDLITRVTGKPCSTMKNSLGKGAPELAPYSPVSQYIWLWDLLCWTCERVVSACGIGDLSSFFEKAEKEAKKLVNAVKLGSKDIGGKRAPSGLPEGDGDHETSDGYESSHSSQASTQTRTASSTEQSDGDSIDSSERSSIHSDSHDSHGTQGRKSAQQILLPPFCHVTDAHQLAPPGFVIMSVGPTLDADTTGAAARLLECVSHEGILPKLLTVHDVCSFREARSEHGDSSTYTDYSIKHFAARRSYKRWKRKAISTDIDEEEENTDFAEMMQYDAPPTSASAGTVSASNAHPKLLRSGMLAHAAYSAHVAVMSGGACGTYIFSDAASGHPLLRASEAALVPSVGWLDRPSNTLSILHCLHTAEQCHILPLLTGIIRDTDMLRPADFLCQESEAHHDSVIIEEKSVSQLKFSDAASRDRYAVLLDPSQGFAEKQAVVVLAHHDAVFPTAVSQLDPERWVVQYMGSSDVPLHDEGPVARILHLQSAFFKLQVAFICQIAATVTESMLPNDAFGKITDLSILGDSQGVASKPLCLEVDRLKSGFIDHFGLEISKVDHFFRALDDTARHKFFVATLFRNLVAKQSVRTKSIRFVGCTFSEADILGMCTGLQEHWLDARSMVGDTAFAVEHSKRASTSTTETRSRGSGHGGRGHVDDHKHRKRHGLAHADHAVESPLRIGIDSLAVTDGLLSRLAIAPLIDVLKDAIGIRHGMLYLPPPKPAIIFPTASDNMDELLGDNGIGRRFSDAASDTSGGGEAGNEATGDTSSWSFSFTPDASLDPRQISAAADLGAGFDTSYPTRIELPPLRDPMSLRRISGFIGLRHLSLSGNMIGDDGAADIIFAISAPVFSAPLETLDLSNNCIYVGVNVCEALTSRNGLFYNNTTLRSLSLASNPLSESVVSSILKVLTHTKHSVEQRDHRFAFSELISDADVAVPRVRAFAVAHGEEDPPQTTMADDTAAAKMSLEGFVTPDAPGRWENTGPPKRPNVFSWISNMFGALINKPPDSRAHNAPAISFSRRGSHLKDVESYRHGSFESGDGFVSSASAQYAPLERLPSTGSAPLKQTDLVLGMSKASSSTHGGRGHKREGVCTKLSHLNLAGCGLHSPVITDALDSFMQANRTIRELDLRSNNLSREAGARLALLVEYHMPQLWYLRLGGNVLIKDADKQRIATKLQKRRHAWLQPGGAPPLSGSLQAKAEFIADTLIRTRAKRQPSSSPVESNGDSTQRHEGPAQASFAQGALDDASEHLAIRVPASTHQLPVPANDVTSLASVSKMPSLSLTTLSKAISAPSLHLRPRPRLTALIASPLVLRTSSTASRALPALDYYAERKLLWQAFYPRFPDTTARYQVELDFHFSTGDHLRSALTRGCNILHLSCHGAVDWLALEKHSGEAFPLGAKDLASLINAGGGIATDGKPRIQVLVLAACRSFWAAKLFHQAGIPYIVCINSQDDVLDDACHVFIHHFYVGLASGNSVEYSFDVARQAVGITGERALAPEVSKFIFLKGGVALMADGSKQSIADVLPSLPGSSGEGLCTEIWEPLNVDTDSQIALSSPDDYAMRAYGSDTSVINSFGRVGLSKPVNLFAGVVDVSGPTFDTLLLNLPPMPEYFIGRNIWCHRCISEVLHRRCVTLLGEKGVGKSAVAIFVAHWCALRRLFADGVIYVDLHRNNGATGSDAYLQNLCISLLQAVFPDDWFVIASQLLISGPSRGADSLTPAIGSPAALVFDARHPEMASPTPTPFLSPAAIPLAAKFESIVDRVIEALRSKRVLIIFDNADPEPIHELTSFSADMWVNEKHASAESSSLSPDWQIGDSGWSNSPFEAGLLLSPPPYLRTASTPTPLNISGDYVAYSPASHLLQSILERTQHVHVMVTQRTNHGTLRLPGVTLSLQRLDLDSAAQLFGLLLGPSHVADGGWSLDMAKAAVRAVGLLPAEIIAAVAQQTGEASRLTPSHDGAAPTDPARVGGPVAAPGAPGPQYSQGRQYNQGTGAPQGEEGLDTDTSGTPTSIHLAHRRQLSAFE